MSPLTQPLDNELSIYEDGAGPAGHSFRPGGHCYLLMSLLPFAMAIHELTTNALKYGAAFCLAGVLRVSWTLR